MVYEKHIIKGIEKFIEKLKKRIVVKRVIFFGSRTTKSFEEDSDIDLIIVSPNFEGKNFFDRVNEVYNYWELDYPIDFLCYTPKEFNKLKKQISIITEALKQGVEIK